MNIWPKIQALFSRFIPKHVNDPVGLIRRMLTSDKKAATYTLLLTALSILLTPVDYILGYFENGHREKLDNQNTGPHIIICGPARSGTTLMYQVLANNLDVAYARNFTVAFSRAPLIASKYLTRNSSAADSHSYENYYGKTAGWQSPSEANHLWNQWVDADSSDFRTNLSPQGAIEMASYLIGSSASENKPTLSKNNNANAFASQISEALDNTYFICLKRETRYLAQSLLQARIEINGNVNQSYGVTNTDTNDTTDVNDANDANDTNEPNNTSDTTDVNDTNEPNEPNNANSPVSQVLEQIDYLNKLALTQQQAIGEDRFWIVDYQEFCENPQALVDRVRSEILKKTEQSEHAPMPSFKHTNHCTNVDLFEQINSAMSAQQIN